MFDFELRFGNLKAKELFNNWDNYKKYVNEIADETCVQNLNGYSDWTSDVLPFLNLLKLLPSTSGGRETKKTKFQKSVNSFITFNEVIVKNTYCWYGLIFILLL